MAYKIKITKETTFGELTLKYPKTIPFLLKKGLHCAGCHAAPMETIEQGALVHGINPDKLIKELNSFIFKEEKNDTKINKGAYSEQVIEHARNPRNRGIMKNPDATGKGGGPCGDETDFFVKIRKKKIKGKEIEYVKDIKFETMGCSAAIATASMVTEMVKGKPVSEALKISRETVIKKLGTMPLVKIHCVDLTINAILNTVRNWQMKKG